ncbi:MAG TPA: radical SAM protein [Hyphomicrobiaceae bacterium]|nr:radical SAM protein [Hyphomicrobiaceae bacterium]
MRVLYLVPPGRFPTVVVDAGPWWDTVAASGRHQLVNYSANFHWWQTLCGPDIKRLLLAGFTLTQRVRRRLEWQVNDCDLALTAGAAGQALRALRAEGPYRSAAMFLEVARALTDHLAALNAAQAELELSLTPGVRVEGLDYADSRELVAYSRRDGCLAHLIDAALAECPSDLQFLAVAVTSAESLLCAMIAARLLRRRNPRLHVCLADHGYENFSLHAHIGTLKQSRAIEQVFDTIIEAKDDRDVLLPQIIDAVAAGSAPRGFVTAAGFAKAPPPGARRPSPPPPLPTFTPEPVLFTRLSRRRCYWSRCTFCTQNTKYDDPKAASRLEIPAALDRIAAFLQSGYRNVVFSDEAIAPSTLKVLCEEITRRKLDFAWTCRCRLELSHTRELFQAMRAAGCYEVLFGLESISPRVQKLMDKHLEGMDEDRVRRIFADMQAAGLAIHVTMIAGFPGDTLADSERTVEFVIGALRDARNATCYLNQFSLFPDTAILREPARFGIARVERQGDMPSRYDFEFDADTEAKTGPVLAHFPQLNEKLVRGLGWDCLGAEAPAKAVHSLYFTSGCGAILKTRAENPFGTPLNLVA